jgi:sulfonate transport system permease protein
MFLLGWYLLTSVTGVIPQTKMPSPTTVWDAFRVLVQTGELGEALRISLWRAAQGFMIGASIGLLLGIGVGLFKLGEELADPLLQMLRTVPFLAMLPLFVIWFGIGERPKIALIAGACIFSMYLNTYVGVRGVDPKLVEAGEVFGLSRVQVITRIVLPNALPNILTGVRYSLGVSVLALVAAEQINATSGIGYLIVQAGFNLRTDIVVAGVIVYALLGLTVDLMVRGLERLLLPWRKTLVD